jgi:hypothetical protein
MAPSFEVVCSNRGTKPILQRIRNVGGLKSFPEWDSVATLRHGCPTHLASPPVVSEDGWSEHGQRAILVRQVPPASALARRGSKKAIIAVAASMLTAAHHMLRDGVDYRDLGADHFDRRDKVKLAKRLVARLHDLGFSVDLRAA